LFRRPDSRRVDRSRNRRWSTRLARWSVVGRQRRAGAPVFNVVVAVQSPAKFVCDVADAERCVNGVRA
jgi:hypothetical protein